MLVDISVVGEGLPVGVGPAVDDGPLVASGVVSKEFMMFKPSDYSSILL